MAIIVISHQMGAGGPEIGTALAQRLGYRYVNQELLLDAARRYGLAEEKLSHLEESKPTLFERFDTETRHHITVLQTTQFEFAETDNAVLMRGGGQWLLRGVPHALRVRLVAPFEHRVKQWIKRTAEMTGETPNQRAATDFVRRDDSEKAGRMRYLYEVDIADPMLYELIINTEKLQHEAVVDVLERLARLLGGDRGVGGALGSFGDAELEGPALAAPHDAERDGLAHLRVRREALEVVVVLDRRAVERDDHVVLDQARYGGGSPRIDAGDHRALRVVQAERLRQLCRERLHRGADPAARDLAAIDKLAPYPLEPVGGNRKPDALARRDDRGVDPDDLSAQVHERPARVTGIDRPVRLNEILVGRDAAAGSSRRAYDADRHRLVEAERVADRDRPLTNAELVRVSERGHGERRRRLEEDDGEVSLRVRTDDPPAGLLL